MLEKGGFVLFARLAGEIVGTCAIIPRSHGDFELTKLAVLETARGNQVGRRILLAAINRARYGGAPRLYLHTSEKQTAANNLYRKTGFVRASHSDDLRHPFNRPSYTMILDLEKELPFDTERKE